MAKYRITSPDGSVFEVTAPDTATQDEVLSYAQQQFSTMNQQSTPQKTEQMPVSSLESVTRGIMDPIEGGAQLLTHALPSSVVQSINNLNNWLADKGIPLDRIPQGGIDQQIKEQEQAYQQKRQAAGETGVDWWRLAGNVASPANLAVGAISAPARGALLGEKILSGAASGAGMSMLNPVTEGDYLNEKLKQGAIGGATGAAIPIIAKGISRTVQPQISQDVKDLIKEGITPTPGQVLGGGFKSAEEKAASLPVVGDVITASQKRGVQQFNTAIYNRALKHIGDSLPKDKQYGREAYQYLSDKISQEYDDVLTNVKGKLDKKFITDISNIKKMGASLPEQQKNSLYKTIKEEITDKFTKHGLASGETIKKIDIKLRTDAQRFKISQDPYHQDLGNAYEELRQSLKQMIRRINPLSAKSLNDVDRAFAEKVRIRQAMTYTGGEEGIFTPAQFYSAVKMSDKTKGKEAFALGKALSQDIASKGKTVLSNKYPDSGTAGRLMSGGLALGAGYMLSPKTLGLAGLASLPYIPGIQNLAVGALTNRPGLAAPLANAIEQYSPLLTYGIGTEFYNSNK